MDQLQSVNRGLDDLRMQDNTINQNESILEGTIEEVLDQDANSPSESSIDESTFPPRPNFGYSLNSSQLRRRAPMVEKMNLNELPIDKPSNSQQQSTKPSASSQAGPSTSTSTDSHGFNDSNQGEFTCNICFDTASGPVVTLCGHLFCWSCLHRWLKSHRRAALCPVCKAGCSKEQVIPIYGRGKESKDPRLNEDVPERPQAQRPTAQATNPFDPASFFFNIPFNNQNINNNNNNVFQFHMGFGLLPTLFSFNLNNNGNRALTAQQAFLNRLFLMIALLIFTCILWL